MSDDEFQTCHTCNGEGRLELSEIKITDGKAEVVRTGETKTCETCNGERKVRKP